MNLRFNLKDNPPETSLIKVEIRRPPGINLYDNPLETPPVEIVRQGRDAVLEWLMAAEGERRLLNEVKVLLVGDGGAGKTSLVKRLFKQGFDPHEAQTHGILISQGSFSVNGAKTRLRFWDFGGQEIYHATHQFFLSQRSLYILVLDGRKDEKTEYWLKLIRSFGGDSLVLVALNKIDEHPDFEVNRNHLLQKYPAIRGFYRLSCKTQEGCTAFLKGLRQTLNEVELLRTTWPETWFRVKIRLEKMRDHFIGYQEYHAICSKARVTEESAQDTLLTFLHNLGVILHFPDYELLDTHVLESDWVTEAVYRIINSPQVADGHGVLDLADLPQILESDSVSPYRYPREKHGFLIQLMKKFELCYTPAPQHVLIPQMLPVPEPEFAFEEADALRFRIEYDFLPRSIMPRFIVRRHRDIKNELRWRSGVVLEDTDLQATAVVRSDDEARTITIRVSGAQRRDYFQILLKLQRNRRPTVNCQHSTEDVPIANLMEGIEIMKPDAVYDWDVFLSYWSQVEYETLLNEIISGRTRQKLIPLVLDDLAPEDLPLLCRNLRHERYRDRVGYQRVLALLRSR